MLRHYVKIAWRNFIHNKLYSAINVGGLVVSMAVAMLIGLWIYDELSFNTYHSSYDQIAQVMRHERSADELSTRTSMSIPLRTELGKSYAEAFQWIVLSSGSADHILSADNKTFIKAGRFMEPAAPQLLSLRMLKGSWASLNDPSSILLSASMAKALVGDTDPINRVIKIDNKLSVNVSGVYEDIPYNSEFSDLGFIASWSLYANTNEWPQKAKENWGISSFDIFVQIHPNTTFEAVSAKIKGIKRQFIAKELADVRKPEIFLNPMSRWHLYSEWANGVNIGGRIQYVRLFGIVAFFVLLLACINFINLSTARSQKRAKEVGVQKSMGLLREQLMIQFLGESFALVLLSFFLSIGAVTLLLPYFNELADKQMQMPWFNAGFWLVGIGFCLVTGLLAGSYPAFYLSAFHPIHVLKGNPASSRVQLGRWAALPRQVLVVIQFTVSLTLMIGTGIVYQQINFVKNRPIGYNRNGLLVVPMRTPEIRDHYEALRRDLLNTGAVQNMAESSNPTTEIFDNRNGFTWSGKESNPEADFSTMAVTHNYGHTVGWSFLDGRDFSRAFSSDVSKSIILNQAAVKFMGLPRPVGEIVRWGGENLTVIGIIEDMVMSSPYEPVKPTVWYLNYDNVNYVTMRLNPQVSAPQALAQIKRVFRQYAPSAPFDYTFADEDYNRKFGREERIGRLAFLFAVLAIFISCLGLFGLASFVAEQRTKEIGIRKVLGASIINLWALLSRDFVLLVGVAFLLTTPIAWYLLSGWLEQYAYRTQINWKIFAMSGIGVLMVTLLTVSYQSFKAALLDPVKSLKSD